MKVSFDLNLTELYQTVQSLYSKNRIGYYRIEDFHKLFMDEIKKAEGKEYLNNEQYLKELGYEIVDIHPNALILEMGEDNKYANFSHWSDDCPW
jgi:hypothetical protein